MPLYILRCPGSDYTGFRGGVDFFNGHGSTSSLSDAHALAQLLKCGVSLLEADGSERRVRIIRRRPQPAIRSGCSGYVLGPRR